MESNPRLRVGIIGCGYQGGILAQTIARGTALQVSAYADFEQAAIARVAAIRGAAAMCVGGGDASAD